MPRRREYPGYITRRGRTWRVVLCVGGKYHRYTVKGTKLDAENYATVKHKELSGEVERVREGLPAMITFSQLVADFKTQELPGYSRLGTRQSYAGAVDRFVEFFGKELADPKIGDIRRRHVKRFLQWRRGQNKKRSGEVSAYTVQKDRRVLNLLFNYAIQAEYIEANPCHLVKAPKPEKRNYIILDNGQLDALLAKCDKRPMLKLYVLLLAETGLRAQTEALRLTWDDVDLAGGFIHVRSAAGRRTKSGRVRFVPITPRLKTALQEHAARFRFATYNGERSPYLFHHVVAHRDAKAGERIRNMRRARETAAKNAKLPEGFRTHDLRHRRVTTWLAAGGDVVKVKEAMGHSQISTTMDYTHLVKEHLSSLANLTDPTPHKLEEAANA